MDLTSLLLDTKCELAREDVTSLLPPEWRAALGEKKVYVQDMTGSQRAAWVRRGGDKDDIELPLIIATLVDGEGKPLFTKEHRHELERKLPASTVIRLAIAATRVCSFFPDQADAGPSTNGQKT